MTLDLVEERELGRTGSNIAEINTKLAALLTFLEKPLESLDPLFQPNWRRTEEAGSAVCQDEPVMVSSLSQYVVLGHTPEGFWPGGF